MKKEVVGYIVLFVLSMTFIYALDIFWETLEVLFDGGKTNTISDTVIAVILIFSLYENFKYKIRVLVEDLTDKIMEF